MRCVRYPHLPQSPSAGLLSHLFPLLFLTAPPMPVLEDSFTGISGQDSPLPLFLFILLAFLSAPPWVQSPISVAVALNFAPKGEIVRLLLPFGFSPQFSSSIPQFLRLDKT